MSKGKFVLGAAIGAAAGVVAGLLTAPKSGKEKHVSSSKMPPQRETNCVPRARRHTTTRVMPLVTCTTAVAALCAVLAMSLQRTRSSQ